uniref:Uncharacterized protein n=1 Tax=Vitis vinifera TaxID=29760 RepID=A5AH60_VITVI|nr:hypothetical protein VITISV_040156 [Vitis vinifera]
MNDSGDETMIFNNDSAPPASQVHTLSDDAKTEHGLFALMDEICEDAFNYDGHAASQLGSCDSQIHISLDGSFIGEACNLNIRIPEFFSRNLSFNGTIPIKGLDGHQSSASPKGCFSEFMESYCMLESSHLSEIYAANETSYEILEVKSINMGNEDLEKGNSRWNWGWFLILDDTIPETVQADLVVVVVVVASGAGSKDCILESERMTRYDNLRWGLQECCSQYLMPGYIEFFLEAKSAHCVEPAADCYGCLYFKNALAILMSVDTSLGLRGVLPPRGGDSNFFSKINFSQIKSESRRSSGDAREKCGSTPGDYRDQNPCEYRKTDRSSTEKLIGQVSKKESGGLSGSGRIRAMTEKLTDRVWEKRRIRKNTDKRKNPRHYRDLVESVRVPKN